MMRLVEIRYNVLRGGAVFGEIYADSNSSQRLRMDQSALIKMSLSGTFLPVARNKGGAEIEVNWLTDEIQPVLVIDGVESPLGVFAPAVVTPSENETSKLLTIEAYDRGWYARDSYTEGRTYISAGSNYLTAITALLTETGITAAQITQKNAVFGEARDDWEIGTSRLTIINELLAEINYNPLWFDAIGTAILEPASVPSVENIEHVLDGNSVHSVLLPKISRETDAYSAPNVFLCVCANPDKESIMTATAENTNMDSPLSVPRRGRRIMKVVQLNNIQSQGELETYANRLRDESMIGGETITVETALLPGFGVNDVVALNYGDLTAICIDRAWDMDLRVGGTMRHKLERVVWNIG